MAFASLTRRWHARHNDNNDSLQRMTTTTIRSGAHSKRKLRRCKFGMMTRRLLWALGFFVVFQIAVWCFRTGSVKETNPHNDPTRITFSVFPNYLPNNTRSNFANDTMRIAEAPTTKRSSNITTNYTSNMLSTIVVQLKGEMGNHLSSIAHGRGIQLWALEHFGMETRLLFRRQTMIPATPTGEEKDSPKGLPSREVLQQCFMNLRQWDFDSPVTKKELAKAEEKQQRELSQLQGQESLDAVTSRNELKMLGWINGRPRVQKRLDPFLIQPSDIRQALDIFQKRTFQMQMQPDYTNRDRISLPFLFSDSLDNLLLMDRYMDHFRDLFALDHGNRDCCQELPKPDESVFHFRNFATELPVSSRGLEETTPNQTAHVLFGHLEPGDKVVITSRFDNELLQAQIQALRDRGLQVRLVIGQSGIQDFCFLLKAQKELIGNFQSTFALWAAVLGNCQHVRLYTINSRKLKQRFGEQLIPPRFLYKWKHPELKDRVQLELIEEEEVAQQ